MRTVAYRRRTGTARDRAARRDGLETPSSAGRSRRAGPRRCRRAVGARQEVVGVARPQHAVGSDHERRRIVADVVVAGERAARGRRDLRIRNRLWRPRTRVPPAAGSVVSTPRNATPRACITVRLGDQVGRLQPARRAPRAPDVDHQRLAVVVGEVNRLPSIVRQREIRRGLPDRRPGSCRADGAPNSAINDSTVGRSRGFTNVQESRVVARKSAYRSRP